MLVYIDALIAFVGIILLASLLVTVLTQIVVLVINLRGKNLLWGMKRLILEFEPDIGDEAAALVKDVLSNPMISRFQNRLPSVIRMEEFSELLIDFADSKKLKQYSVKTQKALKRIVEANPDELLKQLDEISPQLRGEAVRNFKKVQSEIEQGMKNARLKLIKLESWFDNVTDRMSERFTMYSKIFTVAAAAVVTVLFQLNSITLLQQVYSNPELRAKLVASTDLILQQGNDILSQRSVFDLAMDSLRIRYPQIPNPQLLFQNRMSAEKWLEDWQKANSAQSPALDSLLINYRIFQKEISEQRLGYLAGEVVSLNDQLSESAIQIFGSEYTWRLKEWSFQKILGMIVSIGLLSLGAPFWFNALKNLATLKSSLQRKEESERTARKK